MANTRLPPGFRFHPTDVELVMYYLKRNVLGKKLSVEAISELNIYKFSPWDLPEKACMKSKDQEWYFFSPREKKYASGGRMNRAAETGYWKTTGKDRPIPYKDQVVGMVRTLIFHRGHPPKGQRTDWVMHEYLMQDQQLADAGVAQDVFALCKLFHKDGPGARKGAQYGAPFNEEEWDDEASDCGETILTGCLSVATAGGTKLLPTPSTSKLSNMGGPEVSSICSLDEQDPPSLLGDSLGIPFMEEATFQSVQGSFTEEFPPGQSDGHENFNNSNIGNPVSAVSDNDTFSGLTDLCNWPAFGGSSLFSFSDMQPLPGSFMELNDLNNSDTGSFMELNDLNNSDPDSYLELNDLNNSDPSLTHYGFPNSGASHYCSGSTRDPVSREVLSQNSSSRVI